MLDLDNKFRIENNYKNKDRNKESLVSPHSRNQRVG